MPNKFTIGDKVLFKVCKPTPGVLPGRLVSLGSLLEPKYNIMLEGVIVESRFVPTYNIQEGTKLHKYVDDSRIFVFPTSYTPAQLEALKNILL